MYTVTITMPSYLIILLDGCIALWALNECLRLWQWWLQRKLDKLRRKHDAV